MPEATLFSNPIFSNDSNNSVEDDIDARLSAQSSGILSASIEFVSSTVPFESIAQNLKGKYIYLKPIGPQVQLPPGQKRHQNGGDRHKNVYQNGGHHNGQNTSVESSFLPSPSAESVISDGVPLPKFEIYPKANLVLQWKSCPSGKGLNNLGNTCFMNSILQALTYTAPLVNYIAQPVNHQQECKCSLCILRRHILLTLRPGNGPFAPSGVHNHVKAMMKHYVWGRQEDAHEFLRYFLDSVQMVTLHPYREKKLDMYTKETNPISLIFGGLHCNEIVCLSCKGRSLTYDPFMDISLDVKKADSLEQALRNYVRVEILQGDNAYFCPKCKRKVSATKKYTVQRAPNILTIQLKRFDHGGFKIQKHVAFPEELNFAPYLSDKGHPVASGLMYDLYAVVVHQGGSTHSGHYYSYAKSPSGHWMILDDARVSATGRQQVLGTHAYLLFYCKRSSSITPSNGTSVVQSTTVSKVTITVPASAASQNTVTSSFAPYQSNGGGAKVVVSSSSNQNIPAPSTPRMIPVNPVSSRLIPAVRSAPTTPAADQSLSTSFPPVLTSQSEKKSIPVIPIKIGGFGTASFVNQKPRVVQLKEQLFQKSAAIIIPAKPNASTPSKKPSLVPYEVDADDNTSLSQDSQRSEPEVKVEPEVPEKSPVPDLPKAAIIKDAKEILKNASTTDSSSEEPEMYGPPLPDPLQVSTVGGNESSPLNNDDFKERRNSKKHKKKLRKEKLRKKEREATRDEEEGAEVGRKHKHRKRRRDESFCGDESSKKARHVMSVNTEEDQERDVMSKPKVARPMSPPVKDVVAYLRQHGGSGAYGPKVESWDGDANYVDRSRVETDYDKFDASDQEYNDQYDEGRKRKRGKKHKKKDRERRNEGERNGSNAFQQYYEYQEKQMRRSF